MRRRKKADYTVFIAAEGPSELGELARPRQWRSPKASREGYFQPMLRKLLGENVAFDGQPITHPKSLLRRALGRDPTPADFADLAEKANLDVLRASCPASFAPFAEEAERARDEAVCADVLEP